MTELTKNKYWTWVSGRGKEHKTTFSKYVPMRKSKVLELGHNGISDMSDEILSGTEIPIDNLGKYKIFPRGYLPFQQKDT